MRRAIIYIMPLRSADLFTTVIDLSYYPRLIDFPHEGPNIVRYDYSSLNITKDLIRYNTKSSYDLMSPSHGYMICIYSISPYGMIIVYIYGRHKSREYIILTVEYNILDDVGFVTMDGDKFIISGRPAIIILSDKYNPTSAVIECSTQLSIIKRNARDEIEYDLEYESITPNNGPYAWIRNIYNPMIADILGNFIKYYPASISVRRRIGAPLDEDGFAEVVYP